MEDKSLRILLLDKEVETPLVSEPVKTSQPQTQTSVKPANQTLKVNLTRLKEKNAENRATYEKQEKAKRHRLVEKKEINFFGGSEADFKQEKDNLEADKAQAQPQIQAKEMSSVIETPNYDFIEPLSEKQEEKIFKIQKAKPEKRTSPLLKKIKMITFALLFGVLGSWTIYNAVELSNVVTEYNLKLDQYLMKLGTLDSASGMNDLFPTYPEESASASSIEKQSNWFDRLCNFIAGIFGG